MVGDSYGSNPLIKFMCMDDNNIRPHIVKAVGLPIGCAIERKREEKKSSDV